MKLTESNQNHRKLFYRSWQADFKISIKRQKNWNNFEEEEQDQKTNNI